MYHDYFFSTAMVGYNVIIGDTITKVFASILAGEIDLLTKLLGVESTSEVIKTYTFCFKMEVLISRQIQDFI